MRARDYRQAGQLLALVESNRCSLKTALYGSRSPAAAAAAAGASSAPGNKRLLCALVCRTMARRADLEAALRTAGVFTAANQPAQDFPVGSRHECLVQACDLLLQLQPPQQQERRQARKSPFNAELVSRLAGIRLGSDATAGAAATNLPRYARVNRLLACPEDVLARLADDGYRPVVASSAGAAGDLPSGCYVATDRHVPDLLTLSWRDAAGLARHPLVASGALCLVDKASCLPPLCLRPPPGACVLDACAAPGNKTVQLAAMVGPGGLVLAVDRDRHRFEALRRRVRELGAGDRVRCVRGDCLRLAAASGGLLDRQLLARISHVLVDPSCSGSGLAARHAERRPDGDGDADALAKRLASLANFQATVLRSALTDYPNARRVVYSTCSVHQQENEAVVQEMADAFADTWRVAPLLAKTWPTRGLAAYPCGPLCLRAAPETDRTNGFFVACFKRRRPRLLPARRPRAEVKVRRQQALKRAKTAGKQQQQR